MLAESSADRMSEEPSPRSTVVRIGDIVAVGSAIERAMNRHTTWKTVFVPTPEYGASRGRLIRLVAAPTRAIDLATRTSVRIRRSGASVAHLHWARYAPFVANGRIPLIVHAHGSDVRDSYNRISKGAVTRALTRADAVVAATPDLLEHVPAGSLHIPNPIDTDFWSDSPIRNFRRNPTVLIHARLLPVKGAKHLLDAAAQVLHTMPDVTVMTFGGTAYESIARRLGATVLPPGDLPSVRRALHDSDVVIGQHGLGILSLSELEAMSCGRPVVMPIRHDVAARRTVGELGRRYVTEQHGFPQIASQWNSLYTAMSTS